MKTTDERSTPGSQEERVREATIANIELGKDLKANLHLRGKSAISILRKEVANTPMDIPIVKRIPEPEGDEATNEIASNPLRDMCAFGARIEKEQAPSAVTRVTHWNLIPRAGRTVRIRIIEHEKIIAAKDSATSIKHEHESWEGKEIQGEAREIEVQDGNGEMPGWVEKGGPERESNDRGPMLGDKL